VLIEQITYVLHPGKAPALVAAYQQEGAAVIQANLGRMIAAGPSPHRTDGRIAERHAN
jgi:hypothetical protein